MKAFLPIFLLSSIAGSLFAEAPAAPPQAGVPVVSGDYIRYLEEPGQADRLQTSVVRMSKGNTVVDLVGAVHLADAAYFQNLNELLKHYDFVLYEMVGGEFQAGTDRAADPAAAKEMEGVRSLQDAAKSFLGLEFQLEGIDYTPKNFVHADVKWDEFNELMVARSQSFSSLFARAMSLSENGGVPGIPNDEAEIAAIMKRLLTAVMTGNSNEIKRTIAPLMSEAEGFITQLEGEDGTVIVGERNRVVMEKLAELRATNGSGNYAIFYGAGHMLDLEKRLLADGFQKGRTAWIDAWSMPDSSTAAGQASSGVSPANLLLKLMENNPEILDSIQQLGALLESFSKVVE
ncbi:MAG: hypothetical protein KA250_04545 [Verrucomicrobiales bacterium]|jgi:hypothetical protein|nr:hypothetical protein [Verrucomicrobiales bacterium]MBP9223070.1 hypothetical protein [Verrucomicrobiales bacterium]HQZ26658.1 hypothetical protein [Verrucomicrobiales bacterium]